MRTVNLEDPNEEPIYLRILQQETEVNWADIYLTKEQCVEVRDAINKVLVGDAIMASLEAVKDEL